MAKKNDKKYLDDVTLRLVEDLIPYENNARMHSEFQVAQIARSIKEWGFTNPILISETDTVIAGHGRLLAAQSLGWTEVPTLKASGWTDEQVRAYVIADNQLALNAGWDRKVLSTELVDLDEFGFDLKLVGFSDLKLDELLPNDVAGGLTDEDAVPEVLESPVTKPGDIWLLGDHRIACGDSTSADDVAKLLGDDRPTLMVTDPPYGVEYDADWRNKALRDDWSAVGGRAIGKVENDDRADWSEAWALFPGNVAYVWHGGAKAHIVGKSLIDCGFDIRSQIIWLKNNQAIGRADYHWKHEPCWYAVRKGQKGNYRGGRKQTTIWEIDKPVKSETGHSTQKPIECMRRPVDNNSGKGEFVYEPFSGSGTTIIACEQTGRRCLAMEISPQYVDVAVKRWQDYTGKTAKHAVTGEKYGESV